jgi:hypothetical protein
MDDKGRDVEFVRRVKAAEMSCCVPPDQTIGADDSIYAAAVVEHKKVIATSIKMVGVTPPLGEPWERLCAELFIEYPVAQGLSSIYVRLRL